MVELPQRKEMPDRLNELARLKLTDFVVQQVKPRYAYSSRSIGQLF
jgi:hypothetical protein